jgi:hypothetical protein
MNIIQKVICGLGGLFLICFIFNTTIGDRVDYVIVKHQDRLVEYVCKDRAERDEIILKSNNDVLFFDGQYVYDEPPTYKGDNRVNIVKWGDKVVRGDMDSGQYFLSIIGILLCVLCGIASDSSGDDYY